ncbi:SusD/RagB family nutrient-binding outer membrane lipoprotein [uncultured Chryseobacterium sp.]|uniref:SusD/RagB family nutrient-binding outer membrane lipoprotein n=1 Tax=uncultured Chryseobacterium sp. TaxID=259322 RepID=UPI0025F52964|nr:SusD/RagB family nutrient-binding outer membrane lipoprotein [uncultured Chryseobacterium sp.]
MKNIIKILGIASLALVSITSCERDITTLNVDPKNPNVVPTENLLSTVSYYMTSAHVSASVNENITRFFTQQWTETTYTSETNYYFDQRNQNQFFFNNTYREVLGPLDKAKQFLETEKESTTYSISDQNKIKANKRAILEILSIYGWMSLVDSFGDVPYSQALKTENGNVILQPVYDDAQTIYNDLLNRLDAVNSSISTNLPSYDKDPFYGGDMSKWLKVSNTIKLQMGLNLADVNSARAKSLVESAVTSGVITSQSDNFQFVFDNALFPNPVYLNLVANGRNDFLPSNVFVNFMKANNDPRVPKYFTLAPDGTYKGGIYGLLNTYANFSKITDRIKGATVPGQIFDVVSVKFMLAEAAGRGYNVGTSANLLYQQAVTASMQDWDVAASDITTFLASHPYDATNWKKSIGEAAWIAMYNRGFEAWYFWRRLDYPVLNNAPTAEFGLVRRMPYPIGEKNNNAANVNNASAKIPGGDIYSSRVFWDKN